MPQNVLDTPPGWRKKVAFFAIVTTILVAALCMSIYKIAVANAYVTRLLPPYGTELAKPLQSDARRGGHLAAIMGCTDCHGADYGGQVLWDQQGYAIIIAPNITRGEGGSGQRLTDDDLRRTLQTGLDGERRMLWAMPRGALNALAQDDVWALVDHLRALPPVNRGWKKNRLDMRGYVDVATRRLRLLDRAPLPLVPPKIPRPAVGLDNAVVSFGATPKEYGAWRAKRPAPEDEEFNAYVKAITACGACHGNAQPLVGRVTAPDLSPNATDESRCKVGPRLRHLTSRERAAIFAP